MRKPLILTLALAVVASLAVLAAQSAAPPDEPAIGGYCPVAYVAMHKAVKGEPQFASTYQGRTYLLSNADAKKMFDAAPAKYVPAYDGWCATAVAQGMKLASDPTLFTVHNGRAYLFSNAPAKAMFDKDPAATIAKADANWPKVAKLTK